MMVGQRNMDLEFQFLLTGQLARKAQVTESSGTELPSYFLPGFQVPFIGNFSPVTYVAKDTHRCELNRCACPSGDIELPCTGAIHVDASPVLTQESLCI